MFDMLIKNRYAAMNVDSKNCTVICDEDIANGCVFTRKRDGNDWKAEKPTATTVTGVWMASSPEIVITKLPDGTLLKGIDLNVRDFVNLANQPIDAFKPEIDDVLTIVPAVSTGFESNTYLGIEANKFALKPLNDAPASGFYMEKIEKTVAHIGNGDFVKKAVPAYKYVVRAN